MMAALFNHHCPQLQAMGQQDFSYQAPVGICCDSWCFTSIRHSLPKPLLLCPYNQMPVVGRKQIGTWFPLWSQR
ncbi:MAG: hypothetical protein WBB23_13650 [Desulforhopalus sp.]